MHRTIIPGPPGTGKTERLLYYLDKEVIHNKVNPEKIAYISFSNAAADEARSRVFHQKVNICTMHSLGTKELKINTNTQLLKNNKWKGFQNADRDRFGPRGSIIYPNLLTQVVSWCRQARTGQYCG